MRKWIAVMALVLLSGAAGAEFHAGVRAQTAGGRESDVLPALLAEVRGLRAAMEQMASAGPRVQLALGRLQLQEQRVNTLLRRMEDVQGEIVRAASENDKARQELARAEDVIKSAAAPVEERQQLEAVQPMIKAAAARALANLQRLQLEESSLNQQLAAEQGRWTEINQRLEELERALTRK